MARKKILILTSTGGGGHMSVARALEQYLANASYEIRTVHAFSDIFKSHDIFRYVLPAHKGAEDLYNWFLNNRWIRSLHLYYDAAAVLFTTRNKKFTQDMVDYLKEQTAYTILYFDEKPIAVTPPTFMELKVMETPPGVRGDTAQGGGTKPATLETGLVIQVPLFVNEGDILKVDTRDNNYIERVKK